VLPVTLPADGKIASRVHRHVRTLLSCGGVAVDLELAPLGDAGRIVSLRVDTIRAAVLIQTGPDDDEVAGGIERNRSPMLPAGGERVDAELAPLSRSGQVIALRVDAIAGAVLGIALPDDDEVALSIHRNRGHPLIAGGVGVDPELAILRDACSTVDLG